METVLTTSNISFVLGVLGVMFGIYKYFKEPQTEIDKKASLIAQQLQWTTESVDKRFKDMQDNLSSVMTLNQNHIHTVDSKVDALSGVVDSMGKDIVKIATILEERLPKK